MARASDKWAYLFTVLLQFLFCSLTMSVLAVTGPAKLREADIRFVGRVGPMRLTHGEGRSPPRVLADDNPDAGNQD
jgi:hypothetical protein